jgi:hypothetical protein
VSASRFDRLDRAQDFLGSVAGWIGNRAASVGMSAWLHDPGQREAHQRAARLLTRASNRMVREAASLEQAGVPERVIATRLSDRIEDRARRSRPSRPSGRAAR